MTGEMTVMLIDDDPHTCNLFEMVMDHHKISAHIYNDGESALAQLPTVAPDIVVIDLFLPGLDGYQLFDQIRAKSLAPNTRLVATTAYYTDNTENEISSRGFDGYLAKPLNSDKLVSYLKSIL